MGGLTAPGDEGVVVEEPLQAFALYWSKAADLRIRHYRLYLPATTRGLLGKGERAPGICLRRLLSGKSNRLFVVAIQCRGKLIQYLGIRLTVRHTSNTMPIRLGKRRREFGCKPQAVTPVVRLATDGVGLQGVCEVIGLVHTRIRRECADERSVAADKPHLIP